MKCVLKYPGAKNRIAPWIVEYIPQHELYLEPFFGSGAVFFAKEPCKYETINDIDGMIVNFFRICRDYPDELSRLIHLTPFARDEFMSIRENRSGEEIQLTDCDIENARRFAVRCWQGFGSKMADRCGWKNSKSNKGPVNPKVWGNLPETIIQAAERLKSAQIENTDAIELIKSYNTSECFIYVDPPYPFETRNGRLYRHEMGDTASHIKLLETLIEHKGNVMISGYDNQLYNEMLSGWAKSTIETVANSAEIRTEVIWMNYADNQLKIE